MKNLVLFSSLLLTACGSSPNSESPVFTATHTTTESSQSQQAATQGSQTESQSQNIQQPVVHTDNAPTTVASPTPSETPVVTNNNTVTVNANVPVAVADPNDTNPNHLSHDPVTGLLDYRYGVFEASQGPSDARSNDGCGILTGNGLLTNNGPLLVFGGDASTVNNGSVTWIKGTTTTYAAGTLACSYTFYPDATGTYTCYRPATATATACNTTVVLKVIPHTN